MKKILKPKEDLMYTRDHLSIPFPPFLQDETRFALLGRSAGSRRLSRESKLRRCPLQWITGQRHFAWAAAYPSGMLGGLGGKANRRIYTEVILEIEWAIRNFCCGVWEWHEIRCASLEVCQRRLEQRGWNCN